MKAYDSISWNFMEQILKALRLPDKFGTWILQCLTTIRYSIFLNGSLHGFFEGQNGVRQGDPVSPLIFVICMEYWSRCLTMVGLHEEFYYFPRCKGLNINHLCFADDAILMCHGDSRSVSIIMEYFQRLLMMLLGLKLVNRNLRLFAWVCLILRSKLLST